MLTFKETGLSPEVLKGVEALGFENPTPIQEQTIPFILDEARDLVALAQTGTGKTAAFGLPLIEKTDFSQNYVQALVLCPTRELCIQIVKDLNEFSKFIGSCRITAVYGGESMYHQKKALRDGSQIVVGTPGRTLDLIRQRALDLSGVNLVVLDEADEMLNMGFREDLNAILSETPTERQTLLFSATMPDGVLQISRDYMVSPHQISVAKENISAENIEHHYYVVTSRSRYQVMKRIIDVNPDMYGIIFCRTREDTQQMADKLVADGCQAGALHGGMGQGARDKMMQSFRSGRTKLLVATDVAARGIDVSDVTHVINHKLPDDPEVYVHRSGRTGRAGKSGISIALVSDRDKRVIRSLERMTGKSFERKDVPQVNDIYKMQVSDFLAKLGTVKVKEGHMHAVMDLAQMALEGLSKEELIRRMLALELERLNGSAEQQSEAEAMIRDEERSGRSERPARKGRERGRSRGESNGPVTRFKVNMGSQKNMNPGWLLSLINEATNNRDIVVDNIRIQKTVSFFEVSKSHQQEVLTGFGQAFFNGLDVSLDAGKERGSRNKERFSKEVSRNKKFKKFHRKKS